MFDVFDEELTELEVLQHLEREEAATRHLLAERTERRDALLKERGRLYGQLHATKSHARMNQLGTRLEEIRQELLSAPLVGFLSEHQQQKLRQESEKHLAYRMMFATKGATAPAKLDANEKSKRERLQRAIQEWTKKEGWAPYSRVYKDAKKRSGETSDAFRERISTYPGIEFRNNPTGKGVQVRAILDDQS